VVGPLSEWIASVLRNPPAFLDFLQGVTGLDVAVYAALLILIVLFMPKGIYGTLRDRFRS
jgi:branched-chain amino acid transport system permease protein